MPRPQTLSIRSGTVQIPYSFLPFSVEFRLLPRPSNLLSIHDSLNVSLVELLINDNHTLVLEAESHQIRQVSLPGESADKSVSHHIWFSYPRNGWVMACTVDQAQRWTAGR